jgi:RHS repeat-associated protein
LTDDEHSDDASLFHMNGRVYDYNLGRFLSVDPFIQAPGNSQSMNPYSYIMNNPLAGTDPTGYMSVGSGGCDLICASDADLLSGRLIDFSNGNGHSNNNQGAKVDSNSGKPTEDIGNKVIGTIITDEHYGVLSKLHSEDRRTEYYVEVYDITGSQLAIEMAQISCSCEAIGGIAWFSNAVIKEEYSDSYPGSISDFSTSVFQNDFAQIRQVDGGYSVPNDLGMLNATVSLWDSVGLLDVAPPRIRLEMEKGNTNILFDTNDPAMKIMNRAAMNEMWNKNNRWGLNRAKFLRDHSKYSISTTKDGKYQIYQGNKVYININTHPTKDIMVLENKGF